MEKLLCSILPKEYAEKNCVFPISIENGKLKVMMQSYDIGLMNELKLLCQKDIGVVLEDRFVIEKNIEEGYKGSNTGKDLHNKMVEEIIKNAIKISASDIHIEPFENFFKLRYRINGDLKDIDKYSLDDLNPIVSIIKLKANCDIGEKRLSQDGRFTYQYNNTKVDCRLSIIPTINGEKLVIRLLNHSEFLKSRNELGFSKKAIKYIDQIINQKHGILERYMINASLKGIISQKLIKKKIIYDNYLKDDRCLIYEILKIDKEIKEAIISEKTESQLKDLAIENGMITYEESIKEKN
ncbi:GspE/PulE family protein [Peptostreptococcus equinus]|uniref:ATPase, T2SS/T4P/T4SS family n=1 Tax=Peptostreptococcus equinus TaxID=3003601 RepID=A0ABY7JPD8_9FIRM|nr:ATPase, T2SS/T4P/T4SS family [Peptostreptococcus sp. CBA3647]WAW15236.1 ATPase, T2SS/T4P/T4SS family [Peptostreptococcus sp. CBA3647]